MINHGNSFQAAQRAWDNMEPPLEDHDTDAMDDYCEPEDPRIDEYEWEQLGGYDD